MPTIIDLKAIIRDPEQYARVFQRIKTKAQKLIPMRYNTAQKKLHRVWQEQEAQGKPVRIIVLKARREGISTYVQTRLFHRTSTKKYVESRVISHEGNSTDALYGMSLLMWEQLPDVVELSDGQRVQIKPETKYSNRKELSFSKLHSRLMVYTAGGDSKNTNSGTARGDTIHCLHASELAFWPAAKQTLTSLLQCVPNLPGTAVILESTANGVGDEFYRRWQDAKAGLSDYIPVFLPWWIHEEYRMPVTEPFKYDEEELKLKEEYGIDDEQLMWRRYTIRNECGNDVEQFHQEYPSSDAEAFLTTGRPFFNREAVMRMRQNTTPPKRRGYILSSGEFLDDPKGYISIWEEPKTDHCYCVGGDVAEGLALGDYSVCYVLDRTTGETVAEWHGHIEADMFGEECVRLATMYNKAWLGIEVNNHGLTSNKAAVSLKYNRLYERKIMDEQRPEETDKIGWRTDTLTRPVMLDEMARAIREGSIKIYSERLIDECLTFVRNDKGKPEGQTGCNDDCVMAFSITLQMHKLCPMQGIVTAEEQNRRRAARAKQMRPTVSSITGY